MRSIAILALAGTALAAPEWHKTMKDGVSAAAKSSKPVLVVTAWKQGT